MGEKSIFAKWQFIAAAPNRNLDEPFPVADPEHPASLTGCGLSFWPARERTLVSELLLGVHSPWSKVVESRRHSSSPGSQLIPVDPDTIVTFRGFLELEFPKQG